MAEKLGLHKDEEEHEQALEGEEEQASEGEQEEQASEGEEASEGEKEQVSEMLEPIVCKANYNVW